MDEKISYYAVIPANVRYDNELPPNAKLLYGEITALCNQEGYCWATNDYFSKLYKCTRQSISSWIAALKERGYISIEFVYKEGSKEILNRYIKLFGEPMEKNFYSPMEEKVKDNNTLKNNTINNTLKKERKTTYDAILSGITDTDLKGLYLEYIKMRKLIKAPLTDRALEMLINKVNKLEPDSINNQKQMLETAIMNNWKSVYPIKKEVNNVQPNIKRCGDEYAFLE